jgi:hypothetical protein
MDIVEAMLRLDRSVAERLRDPAERARYEAFRSRLERGDPGRCQRSSPVADGGTEGPATAVETSVWRA